MFDDDFYYPPDPEPPRTFVRAVIEGLAFWIVLIAGVAAFVFLAAWILEGCLTR